MLSFLKNKHIISAMFIAPILALLAYFGTDMLVSEPPHAAKSGNSYPMVAKSNCRYESGLCTFKNGELEIHFRASPTKQGNWRIQAETNTTLDRVLVGVTSPQNNNPPSPMYNTKEQPMSWEITVPRDDQDTVFRVAVMAQGATFFAETETKFFRYDTNFSQENFSKI